MGLKRAAIRYSPDFFRRAVLGLSALISAWIAYHGLFSPDAFMASFHIAVDDPVGRNEIRGQYGGFFVAVCIVLLGGAVGWLRTSTALILLAALYAGVLLGLISSLTFDGWDVFADYPQILKLAHGMDAIGLLLTLIALVRGDRKHCGLPAET